MTTSRRWPIIAITWASTRMPATGDPIPPGGGHAHSGAMIYLGDSWPAEYRGSLFMNNIHGARINRDILKPNGSGFIGSHAPDFLLANDSWSQIVHLEYGPDGSVYMIDWYDKNQCHHNEVNLHDRTNGRIFKVRYGGPKPDQQDLRRLNNPALVRMQASPTSGMPVMRVGSSRSGVRATEVDEMLRASSRANLGHPEVQLRILWRSMPSVDCGMRA